MASTLQTPDDCCDDCGPCDVSVTLTDPAVGIFYRDTIAEMRDIASSDSNKFCMVGGDLTPGDGGGGGWFWVAGGTTADDGSTYIRPNDYVDPPGGIWQKLF